MERTLIVLKPDAVQRQLVGKIIQRFEAKGLKLVGLKMLTVEIERARRMYAVHEGKDFYDRLIEFMTSSPVVAMIFEGLGVVDVARKLIGATFGPDAEAGTIRGDFVMSRRYTPIHGSDSTESADYEIGVLFSSDELQDYSLIGEPWIYDMHGPEPI